MPPPSPPPERPPPAAVAALLLAAACGGPTPPSPPPAAVVDLLSQRPDEVSEDPGSVRPDPHGGWAARGIGDWGSEVGAHPTEGPFAWAHSHASGLVLQAAEKRDRVLELRAWSPVDEGGGARLTARMKGIELGVVQLTAEPAWHRLDAPAVLWEAGDNRLELEVDRLREAGPDHEVAFALAQVSWGAERLTAFDPAGPSLTLPAGTGATWRLEWRAAGELVLGGRADGPGELQVELETIDPRTGDSGGRPTRVAFSSAGDEDLDMRLDLPEHRGEILEVQVGWLGEGSSAKLDELALHLRREAPAPPIIFISVDTLAARHMSVYGYERPTTPALERFAEEAVTFESCRANAPWTLPSYLSALTGIYPYAHFLRPGQEGDSERDPELWEMWHLADNRWTLAEALGACGYETAAFVDSAWLTERFGFAQGFDVYDTSAGRIEQIDREGGIRRVRRLAADWLAQRQSDSPYFLFLHALDVHAPYLPDETVRGEFVGDAVYRAREHEAAPAGSVPCSWRAIPDYVSRYAVPEGVSPEELRVAPLIAAYDEGVLFMDAELDLFFDELKSLGLYDEAIIVISSDHGESMTEHEWYFDHGVLYDDVSHVPFLVKLPGGASGGLRVEQGVQLVDLYPTLLDLAGADPAREYLHGRSLVPFLEGGTLPPAASFMTGGVQVQAAVEYDGWKLILSLPAQGGFRMSRLTHPNLDDDWIAQHLPEIAGAPLTQEAYDAILERWGDEDALDEALTEELGGSYFELFHLGRDPAETENLAYERPGSLAPLVEALEARRALQERARQDARVGDTTNTFSDAELEELRNLGYLGEE